MSHYTWTWTTFSGCHCFSDICLIRHNSQSMECSQRILYVNVTNTQGLCESSGLCQGQGACGISRSGSTDLSMGCEHVNSTDRFQQHCHQYVDIFPYVWHISLRHWLQSWTGCDLSLHSLVPQREQGLHLQSGYEPDGHSHSIWIHRKGVAKQWFSLEL